MREIGHFIGGKRVKGTSGRFGDVFNPNTGEVQAKVALASKAEVEAAIANAAAAQPEWAATNPQRRARVMFKFLELVQKEYDDLARLLSSEHGKVFADAKGDIQRGLEVVEFACGIPHLLKGEYTEGAGPGIDLYSMRQPLGVVAGITPFNFPAMIPLWKCAPAIACGNAFILKPSERDPSVPMRIAELFLEAGLPPGILNVVNGDKDAVDTLLTDARVKAIGFVGSSDIAEYIYSTGCRARQTRAVLRRRQEPHDRDAGRRHGPGGRRADRRRLRLGRRALHGDLGRRAGRQEDRRRADGEADAARRKPEDRPLDRRARPTTARWSPRQLLDKVRGYIDTGVKEGAKLVVDGRGFKLQGYENGNFIGGCLFDEVKPDMKIYKEEIFGPVLSVVRAKDYDEAVRLPSDHEYGNGVAIFTRDGDTARDFANRVQVGMVGVNFAIPVPLAYHTFGGWKRSGFGDLNQHGPDFDPLLHQDQDGDLALAVRHQGRRRVRHPDDEVRRVRAMRSGADRGCCHGRAQRSRLAASLGEQTPASQTSTDVMAGRWILAAPNAPTCGINFSGDARRATRRAGAGRRLPGQVLLEPQLGARPEHADHPRRQKPGAGAATLRQRRLRRDNRPPARR